MTYVPDPLRALVVERARESCEYCLVHAGRGLYVLALAQPHFRRRALIAGAGWAGRTNCEL